MRRGRIFIYLAFILFLGLVAVVLVYQRYLTPQNLEPAAGEVTTPVVDTVNVIVVAQRVPRGSALNESVLGMVEIQRDLFIQGMYTNIGEVNGRLAKFDLDTGIPLTSSMLVDSAEQLSATGSMAALSIPRGMVAVSIPINRLTSVSYALQPGDHVNLIVTMAILDLDADFQTNLPNMSIGVISPGAGKMAGASGQTQGEGDTSAVEGSASLEVESNSVVSVSGGGGAAIGRAEIDPVLGQTFYVVPSERQRPRMVSQSLLQDAIVLNVGDFDEKQPEEQNQATLGSETTLEDAPPSEQAQQQQTTQGEEPPVEEKLPEYATLIVTPQDAITLNYLINNGAQLSLALRAAGDDSRINTEGVTLQYLLDQYNLPVPVKLPYGAQKFDPPTVSMPTPVP